MKKILFYLLLVTFIGLSGCIKNDLVVFTGRQAEIDATSWNANAAGLTYPILGRAGYGRVANSQDSTFRRFPQTYQLRINMIGPQSAKDETVGYNTFTSPITSFSMPATGSCTTCTPTWTQTPAAAAATLTVSDAVAGTHYAALSGTVTIPANTSFGFINIQILNPGPTAGQGRFLGIQLNNNGTVKAALNYSQVGLVIDQR